MSSRDRRRKLSNADIQKIRKANADKQKKKESFKWHWSLTVLLIGFVFGIISFSWLAPQIIISKIEIVIIILAIAAISTPLQYKYFKTHNKMADTMKKAIPFYLAYNIAGIGFIGLFILLTLNISLASNEIIQEHYSIVGNDPEYEITRGGLVVFLLENDMYESDVYMRTMPYKHYTHWKNKPVMEYDFNKGLFGYNVKVDHRMVVSKPADE